ncbi:hypothetical protein KQI38_03410 [Tissierella carlieri]|uniref:hypothetical protein n=1 Tax=Tissierella carlieri TaxID=689904 RepID=UPI001C1154D1|nr:hypothetical protein [Tissierella carlieri]MBU5311061.1 hypothetical protein [Tissierella carlieri]
MNNIERLKLELNNREYFTDGEYAIFLEENNLNSIDEYDKSTMQRDLLYTVIDVLESLANDVDLMRKIETEFTTTSEAVKFINDRIERIKNRIENIRDDAGEYSSFQLLFTRK